MTFPPVYTLRLQHFILFYRKYRKQFKMKKPNSELVLDYQPPIRKTFLQRNPSLKSTTTQPQPQKQLTSISVSKIKAFAKNSYAANESLKIDRKRIVFYGTSDKQQQYITLQNIGKDILKINLAWPKTKYFQLWEETKNFTLSAGMSKKICVDINRSLQFTDDSYCDDIVIQTETSKDRIKLEWFLRKPCLKYTPLIDLKTLDLGKQQRITIEFSNQSSEYRIPRVRLIKDAWDNIQITPDQFSLSPSQAIKVEMIIYPQTLGAYHHKIVVEFEDKLMQPLEITYSAIDYIFRIENQKQEVIKELDFGNLLRGIKKEMSVFAHNNSPNEVELKSKIKIGKTLRAESTLQSPQELGVECSSTVIEVINKTMKIAPFSRKKLTLTTETKVEDQHKLLVDRFAKVQGLSSTIKAKISQEESEHHQILVCQFLQVSKKSMDMESFSTSNYNKNVIVTPMHTKFSLPTLKILPNSLNMGKVCVGGTIQGIISIQNLNSSINYHLSVNKLFSVDFFLQKSDLQPKQITQLEVFLKGINIGSYHTNIQLVIFDIYLIKIPMEYEVINLVNLEKSQERLYKTGYNSVHNVSEDTVDFSKTIFNAKIEKNRSKYEKINYRKGPSKVKSSQSLFQRQPKGTEVLESLRNSTTKGKDNVSKQKFPGDEEISCNLHETRLSASQGKKYNLFVTKKIDKYVPYEELKQHKKLQKTRNNKDYFNNAIKRAPKNRKQAEEIERELSPEQLKLITINEKIINFGRIFIKSRVEKEFIVGNNTEAAIIAQLNQNINDPKKLSILSECDFEPQIISQNGAARFKIVFNAQTCGKFESTLSYTINGIHTFQLLIEADIELVSLNISKANLKMAYLDDVNEILLKDNFVLKNDGNNPAQFSIVQSNSKYIIEPENGLVQKGESITVWVMQNNQNYPVIQAGENYQGKTAFKTSTNLGDDRILIKIVDGNDISLKVITTPGLCDPRCIVKQSKLVFGCTIVSKPKIKSFQLKNLSRTLCLFEIFNEQCSEFLSFDCVKGRIPPEGSKEITVTYRSTLIHCLISNFQILVRGGLIINVPIQAESIAPDVSIIENEFHFGEICCDTAAVKPISIKNESQTLVELYADLRNRQRGVDFLMISLWNSITTPIGQKFKSLNASYRTASFEEEIIDNAIKQVGVHRIKIDAKSILTFNLVYKPTIAGFYEFVLPIFLENFIRNESLSKVVSCNAIEPKFIIEPNIIKFKKKIINDKENSCFHPFMQYLTLRNPTDKILKWKLDMHGQHKTGTSFSSYSSATLYGNKKQTISPKLCFEIEEKKGELKPKQSVSINVSFNPLEEGFYCHKVPLFIFSEQKGTYHQQAEIRLEGEGKYPSLYFNRKELIMPVVPIGIESISMFQVYNQGYESINLNHRFQIMDSQGNIHVSKGNQLSDSNFPEIIAVFPEGGKMGMNKRQLFVILKFISKKSLSFTCKLELYDDATDCRTYSLPISGTSDNSILTTFSYLSDTENIYRFEQYTPESIQTKKNQRSKIEELQTNPISVTLKTNDGRNLIDRYHSIYEDMNIDSFNLDCRIIKRWLNNFFREEKVRDFPTDLSQNGEILLKLLHKLTNKKEFDGNWEFQLEGVGKEVLNGHNNSLVFYEQVLRIMKTMGCLLNHIRPYYLLEKQDFLQYMSKDPNWRIYSDYYIKKYEVIYQQAWIVLIYQIIQHFWCARIRNDSSYSASKIISNVYSSMELQVIRWVKAIYEQFNELEDSKDKFISFGSDYKDCIAPIYCLMKYSISPKKLKSLQNLNRKPISFNEFASNTKILYQMLEKLNIVPLIYEDEYQLCKQKEIFMFMYQLYEILPQTNPKLPPVIFTCELGESCSRIIDIRNPSSKAVHYWVKLEGCRDFSFEQKDAIVIQAKSTYPFRIDYKSRLSSQQISYISFFSKQEAEVNSINGSALVFELRSKITGRKSIKKLENISCPLYETISIKVLVENIFEDHDLGNFTIELIEESLENANENANANPSSGTKYKIELTEHRDTYAVFQKDNATSIPKPIQFYSELETLKIKKGSATSFDLYFMPIKLSRTKCYIIFNDPIVGEFQYEIIGISQIPKPLQEIKYQSNIFVGNKDYLQLNLPVYNSYMIKCESYFEQKFLSIGTSRKNQTKEKQEQKYKLQLNMDPKINEYMTFPNEVTLKNFKKDLINGIDFQNKIKLQYHFAHLLKELVLDFLLIGDLKKDIQDVRRFKVGLNIVHKPLQQELVMTTTARKPLSQQIPLENTSNKDWKIKVSIVQNQNGWLSLKENEKVFNKETVIKKGQSQAISICFQPKWIGKVLGRVNIHNQTTNQQLIFFIRGISEEPLSQNHFHLKVNTMDSTLFTVPIVNPYHQKTTYRIVSDIDELQLPPDIVLEPSEQIQFNFIAESIASSPQIGFIKFIDQQGRYFWYSITLECSQKKVRQFWVQMSSEVGKQIEKVVEFKNPFNKQLSFKVEFPKDCGLEAKQDFVINPHSTQEYKIKFKPFKPVNLEITLKAFNKEIGNFIYHTKLAAKEEAKRKLYSMSVEVGKVGSIDFKLENNFKSQIKVNYQLSNENSYDIDLPEFLLPSAQNICKLKFKPSAEGKQFCTLKIWGEHFPTKLFQIEGSGIAPYSIEAINFKAHVNQTCLQIIKFNNPNPKKAIQFVKVCLSQAEHGCFRIVNRAKHETWQTEIKDLLIIPIQFQPKQKGYFQSVLTIQCFHYQWKYLLKGSTSFKQNQRINEELTSVNKEEIIKLLKIPIPEYLEQSISYFNKIEIEHVDKKVVKCLRNWMKLKLNNSQRLEDEETDDRVITVYMKFKPKKQIKEVVKLVLSNSCEEGPKVFYNMLINVHNCGTENVIPLEITTIKVINFDISLSGLGLKDIRMTKATMAKGAYCEVERMSEHIRLKFKPNHLIFNRSRVYSDNLMLESEEEEWNFEVQFTLKK